MISIFYYSHNLSKYKGRGAETPIWSDLAPYQLGLALTK